MSVDLREETFDVSGTAKKGMEEEGRWVESQGSYSTQHGYLTQLEVHYSNPRPSR